jgi:hypothetical protein
MTITDFDHIKDTDVPLQKKLNLLKVMCVNRSCMEDKHHCRGIWIWSESRIQVICGCECHNDVEQNKKLYARSVSIHALENPSRVHMITTVKDREGPCVCDQCGHLYGLFDDIDNSIDCHCSDCDFDDSNCPDEARTLKENRNTWHRENYLTSRIVQLENKLGRPLTRQDLNERFGGEDLASITDRLPWLGVGN